MSLSAVFRALAVALSTLGSTYSSNGFPSGKGTTLVSHASNSPFQTSAVQSSNLSSSNAFSGDGGTDDCGAARRALAPRLYLSAWSNERALATATPAIAALGSLPADTSHGGPSRALSVRIDLSRVGCGAAAG